MIISEITSGLGNQLFQYAFAKSLAIRTGKRLLLDISNYEKKRYVDRRYLLNHFQIKEKAFGSKTIKLIRFGKRLKGEEMFHLKEGEFSEIDFREHKNIMVSGYWQDFRFFEDYRDDIQSKLRLKTPTKAFLQCKELIATKKNSIAFHVRRGDYAFHKKIKESHGCLSIDYYRDAAKILLSQLKHWTPIIFSDDPSWAKENLLRYFDSPLCIDHIIPDYEQLVLMGHCDHQVIANSTFSWWGAWLNVNPKKIVISPKKWFKGNPAWNHGTLLPESWITIDNQWDQ